MITNILSRYFGTFANKEFPTSVQGFINLLYVSFLRIDLSEHKRYYKYKSLNKLFTRKLEYQRKLDDGVISPCDCKVNYSGNIDNIEAKGISYSLNELLGGIAQETIDKLNSYINLYLSPRDYHRYHIPCNLHIDRLIYVKAKLYPVNSIALKLVKDLYIKNERVIIEARTDDNRPFIIVLVGALNVGKIIVHFEQSLKTNDTNSNEGVFRYENLYLKKGDEFGYFALGSSILCFTQDCNFTPQAGDKLRFGQKID